MFTLQPQSTPPAFSLAHLDAAISAQDSRLALEILQRLLAPIPTQLPADWCLEHLILKTPAISGPFSFHGREYMRDPINDIDDPDCAVQTKAWGTGNGKSIANIAKLAWAMINEPFSGLYVMPTKEGEGGARKFNNESVIETLKKTPCLAEKLPQGSARHKVSGLSVVFAGNNLGFVGANSATQLGAKRCRIVILDEQDKYKEKLGKEAGSDYLARERTKQVHNAKIVRSSTPTHEDTGIWPHLMAGDLRRRFLPCPHCNPSPKFGSSRREETQTSPPSTFDVRCSMLDVNSSHLKGWLVLIKDPQYTVLPLKFPNGTQIPLSPLVWDKEAKRQDGSWDRDRIASSAHFGCPHCQGQIRDHHRLWLDQHGIWLPTQEGTRLHRSYHLPSFYAPWLNRNFDTSWGGMALKFIDSTESLTGMAGYINSELAEVNVSQEHASIQLTTGQQNFAQTDWTALMTVDYQKLWPYIWFLIQKWSTFKLQPPLPITNGIPDFVQHLDANPHLKKCCDTILADYIPAWIPIAELIRFTSRADDQWPLLDYLIAQDITGVKLVQLFRDRCNANTLDLGRHLYQAIGQRMPKGGDSEIIAAGHCELSGDDAWAELRELQTHYNIGHTLKFWDIHPNRAVMIDSGYAEEHNPEVLRKCFESGDGGRVEYYDPISKKFLPNAIHEYCRPILIDGWIPFKGYPINKRWTIGGIPSEIHWAADDPFKGLAESGKYTVKVLEAASELYFHRWMDSRERQKEIRDHIAANQTFRGNVWSVSNTLELYPKKRFTREDFERHMNAKGRNSDGEIWERGTGGGGKRRHPDHLNDCARNQYPLAESHGFFSYETTQTQ